MLMCHESLKMGNTFQRDLCILQKRLKLIKYKNMLV